MTRPSAVIVILGLDAVIIPFDDDKLLVAEGFDCPHRAAQTWEIAHNAASRPQPVDAIGDTVADGGAFWLVWFSVTVEFL